MHHALRAALLSALVISQVGSAAAADPALAIDAKDPTLNWGPCPDFMPKGCGLAVLHGDPAQHNADVLLRIPAGATIPSHWHTSAERMVLVSGELRVAYQGQPSVTLRPGMYAYGPAKHPHSASCGATVSCVLFIAFEAPVDAVAVHEH